MPLLTRRMRRAGYRPPAVCTPKSSDVGVRRHRGHRDGTPVPLRLSVGRAVAGVGGDGQRRGAQRRASPPGGRSPSGCTAAPIASGVAGLQSPLRSNSAAAAPPKVKALKVSVRSPLLRTMTFCVDVAPSCVSGKVQRQRAELDPALRCRRRRALQRDRLRAAGLVVRERQRWPCACLRRAPVEADDERAVRARRQHDGRRCRRCVASSVNSAALAPLKASAESVSGVEARFVSSIDAVVGEPTTAAALSVRRRLRERQQGAAGDVARRRSTGRRRRRCRRR